jgi:hypothetical protein
VLSFFSKSRKEEAEFKHAKGEVSEDMFRDQQLLRGNSVIKRDQKKGGWDYTVRRANIFGYPVGPVHHVEVKSNHWNRETKRQRMQKAKDKNYRRVNINIDNIPGSNILVEGKVLEKRYRKTKWLY